MGPWNRQVVLLCNAFNAGTRQEHRKRADSALDFGSVFLVGLLPRSIHIIAFLSPELVICNEAANACWSSKFYSFASITGLESLSLLHTCTCVPGSSKNRVSHVLGVL